ncbi:hypothetical protein cyc_02565 [Cyclospora cayetanensis]|uniref:Uncharacterized protein n=1 Tax=Cyclospora cayetanensis TaxID=88456 RepID=A0A1D3CYX3_9EIME|nr:hypothetical protein cyc_02565 [Cyclospora cayetanensis]
MVLAAPATLSENFVRYETSSVQQIVHGEGEHSDDRHKSKLPRTLLIVRIKELWNICITPGEAYRQYVTY